jgi:hypothetical protein
MRSALSLFLLLVFGSREGMGGGGVRRAGGGSMLPSRSSYLRVDAFCLCSAKCAKGSKVARRVPFLHAGACVRTPARTPCQIVHRIDMNIMFVYA